MTKLDPELLKNEITALQYSGIIPNSAFRGLTTIQTAELSDIVIDKSSSVIPRLSQLQKLKEDAESETEGLYIFSGNKHPARCRHAAILFIASKIRFGLTSQKFIKWYPVGYGFEQEGLSFGTDAVPQIMVIDAIYENSSASSIEKARTLISKYDPPITIIIAAGDCPLEIAYKKLHMDPARVLRFKN